MRSPPRLTLARGREPSIGVDEDEGVDQGIDALHALEGLLHRLHR